MTLCNGIVQDRSAFHLLGHPLPALIDLASTSGTTVDLFTLSFRQPILLFLHASLSTPLGTTPSSWSSIPGASGSTRSLAALNTHLPNLLAKEKGLVVFGLSTQPHSEQKQAKQRLGLNFDLLSDEKQDLLSALHLPTFEAKEEPGRRYVKRMTLLLRGGQVTRLDYPIESPEEAPLRAEALLKSEEELMLEVEARDAANAAAGRAQTSS